MRRKLRLLVAVGLVATVVDFGLFVVLVSRSFVLAELVALLVAAFVSYSLNRYITFRSERGVRWISAWDLLVAVVVMGVLVDIAVVAGLRWGIGWSGLPQIAVSKACAIGVAGCVRWMLYRSFVGNIVKDELAERVDRPPSAGAKRLSVVVPAYNEGARIGGTVDQIKNVLQKRLDSGAFEILVVDDGSVDDTADAAKHAGAKVISQPNMGKGGAVRNGMLASSGRAVVFVDADLAYPAELVLSLMDEVEAGWDVVVGSRRHGRSKTEVPARLVRTVGGRFVNRLTQLVLLARFRDTQCGIKGFRGDIARSIFSRTKVDGFAFDVELFLIAEQDGFSLLEVPVSVQNRAGSSVSLMVDTFDLLRDLFRIRRRAGRGGYRMNEKLPESS